MGGTSIGSWDVQCQQCTVRRPVCTEKKENLAVVDYLLVLNKCSIERKLKTTLKLHRFIKLYTGILKITSIGILEASVT